MVAIDGVHLKKDLGIDILLDIELPGLPPTRDKTLEIPGMHGVYDFPSEMDPVPHAIPLRVRSNNMADVQRKVKELTRLLLDDWGRPKNVKLSYDLESNKYHWVRYSGSLDILRRAIAGDFTLPFINNKAWHYSNVENNEIHWDSETVTFDDDYSFETVYVDDEHISSPQTVQTFVNGYAIRPKIIITGSGDNVTFRANGKSFSLKNFTDASFEINGQNYTIIKDGANGFSEKVGKDFLELLPGLNDIEISGSNMDFNLSVIVIDQYM
ncbi:phage tail domain-containing protein [Sediminibacillus massiliensis]|uniref:phage tail domain-containing protein n=1 Tax=Sediminibacillus massiliensis TaxID=1926277 RepID=UPI00098877BF|nr:phage tail domain-containing protein [Sediminibacillus massiliensis]